MSARTTAANDPLTRAPVVAALAVAATVATVLAVVLLDTSSSLTHPGQAALRVGALGLTHIVPALYLHWRRPDSRFPALMLIVTLSFGGYGLVGVGAPWPYYLGRLLTFVALPLGFYVVLAFPSGRLVGRPATRVVAAMAILTTGGWLALGLAGTSIPTTISSLSCGNACPASPIAIGDDPDVTETLAKVIFTAVAAVTLWGVVVLLLRLRDAAPVHRFAMGFVAISTAAEGLLLCLWLIWEAFDGEDTAPGALSIALGLTRFGLPIAITAAVILDRGRSAQALRTLLSDIAQGGGAGDLRLALAGVLRDPDLVIARPAGDGWVDLDGAAVIPPGPGAIRSWTEVAGADGDPAIALLHDPALGETPDTLAAAASAAAIAVHRQELTDDLRRAVNDLRASRSRLATAADEERRRLERDLHDSAQQGLVALRVRVAVARETLDGDAAAAARALDDIDAELGAVLDDLRRLSRGLYPPLLEDRGLSEALRSAVSRGPLAVTVDGEIGRLPRRIEVAAYFCCREALQNAAKHAGRDARVTLSLSVADGCLRFAVADDGPGFDAKADSGGFGLAGMRDRAGAVGGRLDVRSSPSGTTVVGVLPVNVAGSG